MIITASICFLPEAIRFFSFPIRNEVRLSFWRKDSRASAPCALLIKDQPLELGLETEVEILSDENWMPSIIVGDVISLGTFPIEYGVAKVISIK